MIRKDRQKLKKFFKKRKMTHQVLADLFGCSNGFISRWYDGKSESKPLKEKLLKLYEETKNQEEGVTNVQ